jgi:PAS domain S-box-containing protein/diguanylate cyclase (GGDEF)-like protein
VSGLDHTEFYREVLDSLLTGVYVVDRHGKVMLWNAGAERITGHLRQDVLGHPSPADILLTADANDNDLRGDAAPIAIALREGHPNTMQVSFLHNDGHRIPARLHTVPLRDAQNNIIGAVESFSEFHSTDDFLQCEGKLEQYGCLDRISGALNHGMVEAHLRETLVTFVQHPVPFSILCVGINDIDALRLRHGQGAIDTIVRVLGQSVEYCLRPTDFIGRWLDNEFLTILMECDGAEVKVIGQRVKQMVQQSRVQWWGDPLLLTVSIGYASARQGDTSDTMIWRAEKRLRQSLLQNQPVGMFR